MSALADTDVLIVGGGILGCTTAYRLAREDVAVAVVDAGVNPGSTTNAGSLHVQMQSRFIKMEMETEARVAALRRHLPLYPKAVRAWEELARELACDIELVVAGGIMIAESDEQLRFLAAKCAQERRLGLEVHMLSRGELRALAPYLGESVTGAEFCADEGKVNTLLANPAIERAARAAGAVVRRRVTVERIERDGRGFAVATSAGHVRCRRIVNAAGGSGGAVAAMVGVPLRGESEPLHMNVTEAVAPMIKHLVQHADRQLTLKQSIAGNLIIGGGRPAFVAENGFPTVKRTSIEGNLSLAIHVVPALADVRLIRTWAGINAYTDGRPVIGEVPAVPGFFNAISGDAGYTLAPFCARLLAELLTGRAPSYDVSDFGIERFQNS